MEVYVLKSAACLAIFFVFYKLFLEKESFHFIKRFYLLVGLVASFMIPLITFTTYVEVLPMTTPVSFSESGVVQASAMEETTNYLPLVIWSLYSLGVLFFSVKFFRNLFSLVRKIQENPTIKNENVFHVLLNLPVTPHTFFSYIFLNREKFQKKEIPQEVLVHEKAHAIQKHSLDILFIELVQLIFWFNPLVYFYKHSIKLNHEFLADKAVLAQGNETTQYQKILLAFSSNASSPAMANSIHYSSSRLNEWLYRKCNIHPFGQVKKRFTVMKTHTSKRALWLKTGLLLPLLPLVLYGFSTTQTVEKPVEISSNEEVQQAYEQWHEDTMEAVTSEKVTQQELLKYNKIAAYWNERFEATPKDRTMPLSQLKELEAVYSKMNSLQKQNAEPFPECTPSSTRAPIQKSFTLMITVSEIQLNGETIPLSKLVAKLDAYTRDWEETDYTSATPNIFIAATPKEYLKKVDAEFRKTNYSKANGGIGLPPPPPSKSGQVVPPPPPPTPSKSGKVLPPPPPPPSPNLGTEVMRKYKNSIILYVNGEDIYLNGKKTTITNFTKALNERTKNWEADDFKLFGLAIEKVNVSEEFIDKINAEYRKSDLAKQSSAKKKYLISDDSPPPPPPPPMPLDHVIEMAKDGADFYYEGKKISGERAIEIVKQHKDINILTDTKNGVRVVKLTTKPIQLKN